VLYFNGRVEKGSKKNFQIMDENDSNSFNLIGIDSSIILSFGKKKKNSYAMDLTYPLSLVQALGICISTLASKFISE
jgi:hypothetical protein